MIATVVKTSTLNAPTIHKLPNGLTIIAEQMPVEAVNLNVWLKVGSSQESDSINGMAHFLEHMVFKGTAHLKSGEFEKLIEERGAVTNAATSQEYTHYYITTAPKDFADLAPLQLDVVLNPTIADEPFQRERSVVLEEIRRSEDNPRRRVFSKAMETCFSRLPYRRPVLGPTSVIEGLTPQQMRDFHSSWYQPQSITVAVVGNQPAEQLIEIVTSSLQKTANFTGKTPQPEPLSPEPYFNEIVRVEEVDPTLQQARLIMMWRVPGMQELSQTYPLDVIAAVLGQGKMSRLFRELREEKGLVSQIGASNMTNKIQGMFSISAVLSTENLAAAEEAIVEHIRKIQLEPISDKDLERINTQVANRFIFSNEKASDRANLYGYYHSLLGDLQPAFNYPSYIRSLDAQTLQAAAKRYLTPEAYGVLVVRPN